MSYTIFRTRNGWLLMRGHPETLDVDSIAESYGFNSMAALNDYLLEVTGEKQPQKRNKKNDNDDSKREGTIGSGFQDGGSPDQSKS